jgi:hypothetical protein
MEYLALVGTALVAMIIINFTREKEIMRISWDKLAQFVAFLVVLFVIRLMIYDFQYSSGTMTQLPTIPPEIAGNKWTLGLVFWEDMFFAVPLYFIWKYMSRKWLQVTLTVIISALFGLGHFYQGWFGVAITSLLPYFVSYHFGKKYGFGTCMLGHILYDVSTVYLILMLPYLL